MSDFDESRTRYCRLYVLNESLFGQGRTHLETMSQDMNVSLNIQFEHCYLLLTGIRKDIYRARLGMERPQFSRIYGALAEELATCAQTGGFTAELGVLNYDFSKLMPIVLSPTRSDFSILPLAEHLSAFLETQYRAQCPVTDPYVSNIMAVSELIESYQQYQAQFQKTQALYHLSFFHPGPQPLTYEGLAAYEVPCSFLTVSDLVDRVEQAIYEQDTALVTERLRSLLLGHIKPSFSPELCADALALLKRRFYHVNLLLGLDLEDEISVLFRMEHYLCLEELYDSVLAFLTDHFLRGTQGLRRLSRFSVQAAAFLKEQFGEKVGLQEVADHLHVNSAYLSRLFKQDFGVGLTQYLTRLRMEEAKRLLTDSNLKVSEIACRVGMTDLRYFSAQFKKATGLQPQAYRGQL